MSGDAAEHSARRLWQAHLAIAGYPDGCLQVPAPIAYTSFFPGGLGLWNPARSDVLAEFPVGGVMVLGHDFHSERGYEKSLELGMESPNQPTWRSLTKMLREAGVPLESCFFTNFYMGLRLGAATTGRYPGSLSPRFVTECRDFLRVQLEVQQPRLVLVLGAWVPSLVAPLGRGLEPWTSRTTLREIDERGLSILSNVQLHSGGSSVWAALSHPSFYPRSASGRVFRGHEGREAHELLVTEAVSLARST